MTQVIRRAIIALGAAALALVVATTPEPVSAAPGLTAAATPESFSWTVADNTTTQYRLASATVSVSPPAGLPAACAASTGPVAVASAAPNHSATSSLATNCNGTYAMSAVPTFQRRTRNCLPSTGVCDSWTAWQAVQPAGVSPSSHSTVVAMAAPVASGVKATAGNGLITVTWVDGRSDAPDLTGYRIVRRFSADDGWDEVANVDADRNAYVDSSVPATAGDVSYQVIATRKGGADAAPSEAVTTRFVPAASGSGTDAGPTGPGGSTGPTVSGGSGGTKSPARVTPRSTNRVVLRAPRVGTPSNAFFPPLLSPPKITEVDTGYNPELPYDPETGDEAAVLPADDLSSSNDDLPGRGLAVPAATALVLAVWALHLRYLASASKPVYVDDFLEPVD